MCMFGVVTFDNHLHTCNGWSYWIIFAGSCFFSLHNFKFAYLVLNSLIYEGLSRSSWTNLKKLTQMVGFIWKFTSKYWTVVKISSKNINIWVLYRQLTVVMYKDVQYVKISNDVPTSVFSQSTHAMHLRCLLIHRWYTWSNHSTG